MGLALDEPTENDEKIPEGKLTFLVEQNIAHIPTVKIDYRNSWMGKGFVVYTDSSGC